MSAGPQSSSLFSVIKGVVRRAAFWSSVFVIGHLRLHPAWILIPLVLNTLEKLSRSAPAIEQVDISALPAWVNFPDTDRAEWLNKVLSQLWPALQNHVSDQLQRFADQQRLTGGLWSRWVRFDKISIGCIPPRIGGVRVFRPTQGVRKEIMMDMEITIATDCDIGIRVLPWVGVTLRDIYVHGTLRVRLKPLIQEMPLFGGVSFAFIAKPSLDTDFGGIANVVDIPGISRMVRNLIVEQIAAVAVMPNFYEVKLDLKDHGHQGPVHFYQAVVLIRILIKEARNLEAGDINLLGKNTSDPYVVLKYKRTERKSQILPKTLNPEWNFWTEFILEETDGGQSLVLEVWDFNKHTRDDFLGRLILSKDQIFGLRNHDSWIPLADTSSGDIRICIEWHNLVLENRFYLDSEEEYGPEGLGRAVLMIFLDSCRNLERNKKGRAPSPVVILSVTSREVHRSSIVSYSQNPVFEEEFHILVPNPHCDDLCVRVEDSKTGLQIGLLKFAISDLLARKDSSFKCQAWRLDMAGDSSQVVMGLQLLSPKKIE